MMLLALITQIFLGCVNFVLLKIVYTLWTNVQINSDKVIDLSFIANQGINFLYIVYGFIALAMIWIKRKYFEGKEYLEDKLQAEEKEYFEEKNDNLETKNLEMKSFYYQQRGFLMMGFLDACGTFLTSLSCGIVVGSLQPILNQVLIPSTMLLSYLTLNSRYQKLEILGAIIIIIGASFAVSSSIVVTNDNSSDSSKTTIIVTTNHESYHHKSYHDKSYHHKSYHDKSYHHKSYDESQNKDPIIRNPIIRNHTKTSIGIFLYLFSNVPMACSSVFKEATFEGGSIDVWVLTQYVSIYQFFLTFLFIPLQTFIQNTINDSTNTINNLTYYSTTYSTTTYSTLAIDCLENSIPYCGVHDLTFLLLLYTLINILFNTLGLWVIKNHSAVLNALAYSILLPLNSLIYFTPLVPKIVRVHWVVEEVKYQFYGLILVIIGFLLYYYASAITLYIQRCDKISLRIWKRITKEISGVFGFFGLSSIVVSAKDSKVFPPQNNRFTEKLVKSLSVPEPSKISPMNSGTKLDRNTLRTPLLTTADYSGGGSPDDIPRKRPANIMQQSRAKSIMEDANNSVGAKLCQIKTPDSLSPVALNGGIQENSPVNPGDDRIRQGSFEKREFYNGMTYSQLFCLKSKEHDVREGRAVYPFTLMHGIGPSASGARGGGRNTTDGVTVSSVSGGPFGGDHRRGGSDLFSNGITVSSSSSSTTADDHTGGNYSGTADSPEGRLDGQPTSTVMGTSTQVPSAAHGSITQGGSSSTSSSSSTPRPGTFNWIFTSDKTELLFGGKIPENGELFANSFKGFGEEEDYMNQNHVELDIQQYQRYESSVGDDSEFGAGCLANMDNDYTDNDLRDIVFTKSPIPMPQLSFQERLLGGMLPIFGSREEKLHPTRTV